MRPEDIDCLTVGGLLDLVAGRRPEDEALVYADRNLRYTYQEFKEVVENCARSLMALGIDKGDHVAVWGQNVPEWVTLQFATGKVGGQGQHRGSDVVERRLGDDRLGHLGTEFQAVEQGDEDGGVCSGQDRSNEQGYRKSDAEGGGDHQRYDEGCQQYAWQDEQAEAHGGP
jgi:hypothetical protein